MHVIMHLSLLAREVILAGRVLSLSGIGMRYGTFIRQYFPFSWRWVVLITLLGFTLTPAMNVVNSTVAGTLFCASSQTETCADLKC